MHQQNIEIFFFIKLQVFYSVLVVLQIARLQSMYFEDLSKLTIKNHWVIIQWDIISLLEAIWLALLSFTGNQPTQIGPWLDPIFNFSYAYSLNPVIQESYQCLFVTKCGFKRQAHGLPLSDPNVPEGDDAAFWEKSWRVSISWSDNLA